MFRRAFQQRRQLALINNHVLPWYIMSRDIHRTMPVCGKFSNTIKSKIKSLFPSALKVGGEEGAETTTTNQQQQPTSKKKKRKKRFERLRKSTNQPNLLKTLRSPDELPDFLFTTKSNPNKLPSVKFEPYISDAEYEERKIKAKDGFTLVDGIIRINPKNFHLAYISNPDGVSRDIVLDGVEARNRALPGDLVAVEILPREQWRDEKQTRTGKVVFLVDKKHSRIACGTLRPYRNHRFGFALFSPVDRRLPRLMVPLAECPRQFIDDHKTLEKTLFVGEILDWDEKMPFANGKILRNLGESGLIEPETEAILINNNIDSSAFSDRVLNCLPDVQTWKVTKKELRKRKDLRNECIFSVDPATARDLDDALSCKRLNDDTFEVGVHIADVSHFIKEGSDLDKVARERATSVYLTQKVIPMLPSALCEDLCSLNPGVERLAYSVIWKMKSDGTIVNEWFGRSVIKSCTKLSYDHAQKMIESNDINSLNCEDFPEIHDKKFSLTKIAETVKLLYSISKVMREERFTSGALDFSDNDVAFNLNKSTGMPEGCYLHEYKDSNRMIEEFMLLANMAVGNHIYERHPKRAILRCHPPPHEALIEAVSTICSKFDINFDATDSGSVNQSLNNINKIEDVDDEQREMLLPAVNLLCMKSFKNAKYFCTGSIEDNSLYRHYALNIPIYTHFTSPIRRYPDILVHRLLTAALDEDFKVKAKTEQLQMWAEQCTAKKLNADSASEQSSQLFLAVYVMEHGPLLETGVVVNVAENSVDVLCPQIETLSRIYLQDLQSVEEFRYSLEGENSKPTLTLTWKIHGSESNTDVEDVVGNTPASPPQVLTMFTPVKTIISVKRNAPTKIKGELLNPHESFMQAIESLKEHSLL